MSNGGFPQNQPRPAQPQQPVARTVPQIPIEMQRAYDLVNALWHDGEVGAKIRATAKTRYNIQLPDDAVDSMVGPLKKEIADLKKEREDERAAAAKAKQEDAETKQRDNIEAAIMSARNKFNLTEDGFNKMIARMKDTQNFTDAEAAAAWVVSSEPPPKAQTPSWAPKLLDLKGNLAKEKVKLLHDDPLAFEEQELQEFVNDPDKYVQETFGTAA